MELEPPPEDPPLSWVTRALVGFAATCLAAVIIATILLALLGAADNGALYDLMR